MISDLIIGFFCSFFNFDIMIVIQKKKYDRKREKEYMAGMEAITIS